MNSAGLHEQLHREDGPLGSSNRGFGLVFAAIFGILGLLPLVGTAPWMYWAFVPAAAFLALAYLVPRTLGPLNRVWTRFSVVLHRVMQPLIMGCIFFVVITPFAILRRLLNRDPLHLRFDSAATTYWIERPNGEPAPDTMKNQF